MTATTVTRPRTRLLLAILGCTLFVAFLVYMLFEEEFYPDPPEAQYSPPHDAAAARRQDLDYLAHYLDLDRAYTAPARAQAKRLLAQDRAEASKMSAAQFDLAIARIAALADNGNSQVDLRRLAARHNRLPCRLYHFSDGYRVIRARPACRELLGAELIAVDGRSIGTVADRMYPYVGGPRNHYEQRAAEFLIESPELLHAAAVADSGEKLVLKVRTRAARLRQLVVRAEPPDPHAGEGWVSAYADQYLSPEPLRDEPAGWRPLLPQSAVLPVFLRDYSTPFRSEYWAATRVYYIQLRRNDDEPGYPLSDFLKRVRREISAREPHFLIVDLRLDQGGELTKTAFLMQDLTELAESIEHVYLLTSAWTFGAGETSAAIARAAGGDRLTIVGEQVGDRLRFWAEGGSMVLPNSQLAMHYTTGLHDYARSCFGQNGCYWVMHFLPAQVSTLQPDIPVPYTFEDYVHLRDPVLQRVLQLTRPGGARLPGGSMQAHHPRRAGRGARTAQALRPKEAVKEVDPR